MRIKSSVRHGKELFDVEDKEDIMDHSMIHGVPITIMSIWYGIRTRNTCVACPAAVVQG
jgi:hypothetical protein